MSRLRALLVLSLASLLLLVVSVDAAREDAFSNRRLVAHPMRSSLHARAKAFFRRLDTDGDGKVNADEIRDGATYVQHYAPQVSVEEFVSFLSVADKDGDAAMSEAEFTESLTATSDPHHHKNEHAKPHPPPHHEEKLPKPTKEIEIRPGHEKTDLKKNHKRYKKGKFGHNGPHGHKHHHHKRGWFRRHHHHGHGLWHRTKKFFKRLGHKIRHAPGKVKHKVKKLFKRAKHALLGHHHRHHHDHNLHFRKLSPANRTLWDKLDPPVCTRLLCFDSSFLAPSTSLSIHLLCACMSCYLTTDADSWCCCGF